MDYGKEQVEKIVLFAVIGAAIIAGFWLGFFSPGMNKINSLRKKCAELSVQITTANGKVLNRDAIRARFEVYEKQIKELESSVPREADTSWILRTVADIEKDLKFKTEKIMPYEELEPPGTTAAPENPLITFKYAQINLKGGYHQIGKFINTLERKLQFLQIINVSIEGDKDAPLQHNVELKVKYIVLKQPLVE